MHTVQYSDYFFQLLVLIHVHCAHMISPYWVLREGFRGLNVFIVFWDWILKNGCAVTYMYDIRSNTHSINVVLKCRTRNVNNGPSNRRKLQPCDLPYVHTYEYIYMNICIHIMLSCLIFRCVRVCVTEYDHCGVLDTVDEICSCTFIKIYRLSADQMGGATTSTRTVDVTTNSTVMLSFHSTGVHRTGTD